MDYRDTSFPGIHSYLKMQRYFIYLSFNGAQYHGWQIQPNGITVQEVLEKALATLLRRETPVTGAGRTDAGVHAFAQQANFHIDTELSAEENVVNSLAAGFYREHGVRRIEPGFDAGPIPEGCRVMRTRYCLRRETGQCLRKNPVYRGRLFLASGRYVYELLFDCARCEMSVVYRGERGEPAREEGARRERKPGRPRR